MNGRYTLVAQPFHRPLQSQADVPAYEWQRCRGAAVNRQQQSEQSCDGLHNNERLIADLGDHVRRHMDSKQRTYDRQDSRGGRDERAPNGF